MERYRVRLYSSKSFKPLGTLRHHKVSCQAAEFCHSQHPHHSPDSDGSEHDGDNDDDKLKRSRWLICGAKDQRITIWELVDFEKKAAPTGENPTVSADK
jgi:ASTRA-associated protein 1